MAKASSRSKTAKRRAPSGPGRTPPKAAGTRFGSDKSRLVALLKHCDELFGDIQPYEEGSVMERAAYLVLREGGRGSRFAREALATLRGEFVNWNEVRLSRPSELARLVAGSGKPKDAAPLLEAMQRLVEMIDQVYNDRNECSLEFLLDTPFKDRLEYLEDVDDLGLHNAYVLLQWLSGSDELVAPSPELAKLAKRLGFIDSAAAATARKALGALVPPDRYPALLAHLTLLAEQDEDEWDSSLARFVPKT